MNDVKAFSDQVHNLAERMVANFHATEKTPKVTTKRLPHEFGEPTTYAVLVDGTERARICYWRQNRKASYLGGYWAIRGDRSKQKFDTKESAALAAIEDAQS